VRGSLLERYKQQSASLELASGERIIYLNALRPSGPLVLDRAAHNRSAWRRHAVMCDGGR